MLFFGLILLNFAKELTPMIKLKKGLDLPITGDPNQEVSAGRQVSKVALLGDDVVGMKPTMEVNVGDKVQTGQLLYTDKKTEGVRYTSPASGEVIEINRGERRAFQSIVIKVDGDSHVNFETYKGQDVSSYDNESMQALLIESGMWPSIRRRPYSKVAVPGEKPDAIFVTAIDTHPLASDPAHFIKAHQAAFNTGVKALTKMCEKVFVCTKPNPGFEVPSEAKTETFDGPHPAGLVGTHIHFLNPVGEKNFVWHIPYAEVVAIGKLIETGKLFTERYVSLAGPMANQPRIVKTRVGASIDELVEGEHKTDTQVRTVSGSVLGGRKADGPFAYLGRFHQQVSLVEEGGKREFLGWHSPGVDKYSLKPVFLSKLLPKKFNFDADTNGSLRSIVPIGSYEAVMPMDMLPTFLLRSVMSGNTDMQIKLGALELDEEDLALCNFVDPSKNDFAVKLREGLTRIEKEGL